MAIPVMLGMPVIVGFFVKVFDKVFDFFARRLTAGLALHLAWVVAYIALITGLSSAFVALLSGISTAMPAALSQGIGFINPGNAEVCASAYFSARVALFLYQHKQHVLAQRTHFF